MHKLNLSSCRKQVKPQVTKTEKIGDWLYQQGRLRVAGGWTVQPPKAENFKGRHRFWDTKFELKGKLKVDGSS